MNPVTVTHPLPKSTDPVYYLFDIECNKIDHGTIDSIANKYGSASKTWYSAARRGSVVNGLYYISRNESFMPPKRASNHNPLLNRGGYVLNQYRTYHEVDEFFSSCENDDLESEA